jgi:endonuclease G, mitochondrial
MTDNKLYHGYNPNFLVDDSVVEIVHLPILDNKHRNDVAPVAGNDAAVLHYINYSVQLSASRKFAFYTASNIDGALFKKASRATTWKKDERAKPYQWGDELYSAPKSNFDKGHMTRREDVQWGNTLELAQEAANATFYYSNAVPQHKDLNQQIWKSLEDYILHTETKTNALKVCVFTGPVLSKSDAKFISPVQGATIQLPNIFWKVIIYPKNDGKLYRVGFMMSQKSLLLENGIIEALEIATTDDTTFMQFDDADTYQVNVTLIEQLAGMKFYEAIDAYKDDRTMKLVLNEIDINPDLESFSTARSLGFSILNLVL